MWRGRWVARVSMGRRVVVVTTPLKSDRGTLLLNDPLIWLSSSWTTCLTLLSDWGMARGKRDGGDLSCGCSSGRHQPRPGHVRARVTAISANLLTHVTRCWRKTFYTGVGSVRCSAAADVERSWTRRRDRVGASFIKVWGRTKKYAIPPPPTLGLRFPRATSRNCPRPNRHFRERGKGGPGRMTTLLRNQWGPSVALAPGNCRTIRSSFVRSFFPFGVLQRRRFNYAKSCRGDIVGAETETSVNSGLSISHTNPTFLPTRSECC